MDLQTAIHELLEEKNRLDKAIRCLEILVREDDPDAPRPGRKGMSDEERKEVSARMKEFWASQRKQKGRNSGD